MDGNPNQLQQRIKSFVEQLAEDTDRARTSETMKNFLRFAASFHRYSLNNSLLIWLQCPRATHVCGFTGWKTLGRYVLKGQRGISILAPLVLKAHSADERQPFSDENEPESVITRFKVVHVWDVSQTAGKPIPSVEVLTGQGCADELIQAILSYAASQGITVETRKLSGGTLGLSMGGRIVLDENLHGSDRFSTAVHELSHELLQHRARRSEMSKTDREVEAEAAAHCVSEYFHISTASPNYLAIYDGDSKRIMAHLQNVISTTQRIIQGVESHLTAPHQQQVVNQ